MFATFANDMGKVSFERTAQVWGISGNLGGGKTLTAVSMAVDAISRGWFVVTNIKLKIDRLSKKYPYARDLYMHIDVQTEEVDENGNIIVRDIVNPFAWPAGDPRGTKNGRRVVVILDEVAEWFDQYANAKGLLQTRMMSWLRHSSKRNQDVIFIVQRREYLLKNFRLLISRWIIVDDLAVWRIPIVKIHIPFMGDYCIARMFDRVGQPVGKMSLIDKFYIGRFYDTSQNLSVWGNDTPVYNSPEIPRSRFPLYLAIFLWLCSLALKML